MLYFHRSFISPRLPLPSKPCPPNIHTLPAASVVNPAPHRPPGNPAAPTAPYVPGLLAVATFAIGAQLPCSIYDPWYLRGMLDTSNTPGVHFQISFSRPAFAPPTFTVVIPWPPNSQMFPRHRSTSRCPSARRGPCRACPPSCW